MKDIFFAEGEVNNLVTEQMTVFSHLLSLTISRYHSTRATWKLPQTGKKKRKNGGRKGNWTQYGKTQTHTTILRPLHTSTSVSQHSQIRTGGFSAGARFHCLMPLLEQIAHLNRVKTLEFS